MNTTVENRYNGALGNAIQREVHVRSPWPPRGKPMDLRCPDCNSADLRKVSLAYQEGQFHVNTRTRLRAFLFGTEGPSLVFGKAVTQGVHWTQLSKRLSPPRKWSYVRLILGTVVVTLAALFAYVVFVASSPPPVTTLPLKTYVFLAPVVFLVLAVAVWRHNHLRFPQEHARWDSSFICQRCGAVSYHDVPRSSPARL
jgi:peptidoglycan/LPS O-acetylase OafA/YrhL